MANIDLSVQKRIAEISIPPAITIIGTGAFGGWVALFAAKSGVSEVVLINHSGRRYDGKSRDIEGREIAIGPFEDHHMGAAKVDALEEIMLRSNPRIQIKKEKITFNPDSDFGLVKGIVFNGVSNEMTHFAIWKGCNSRGISCFSGGYNGVSFSSMVEPPVGAVIGDDLPAWVGSVVMSAALSFHSACVSPVAYTGNGSDFTKSQADMSVALRGGKQDL
ncbi:hypothetical protein [Pseudomonas fluorescens]|uniref:Uncharacterized protein n=1 Tax=Pseudomonas fluorescens TaxID=294 RepID=A0A0F4TU73_PSEFL|nr:hypothetical protein [Pseudomonas fluorescens]KJZ47604.1 hypothetical protein VC34_04350 [Pseudomonas fluorescens]